MMISPLNLSRGCSLHFKRLIRSRHLSVPCLLCFTAYLVLVLRQTAAGLTPLQLAYVTERTGMIPVLLFFFVAFEFCSQSTLTGLRDVTGSLTEGDAAEIIAQMGCLIGVMLPFLSLPLVINLLYAGVCGADRLFYGNFLWTYLLYMVLPTLAVIALAMVISFLKNRLTAYAVLVATAFLISPFSDAFNLQREPVGLAIPVNAALQFLIAPFRILLPNSDYSPNPIYGLPQESFRWQLMLAWFGCLGAVLLRLANQVRSSRRIRFCTCLLAMAGIAGLILFYQPASYLDLGKHWNGYLADRLTASRRQPATMTAMTPAEPDTDAVRPDQSAIRVLTYDLSVRFDRQLQMTARLTLASGQSDPLVFTLYRGYRVFSVRNEHHQNLSFNQSGDWLSIDPAGCDSCSAITIQYAGKSPFFIANRQAVLLPGFFPWYPMPGRQNVLLASGAAYNTSLHVPAAQFKVAVAGGPSYLNSNLTQTSAGQFSGPSDNLTLIGGFIRPAANGRLSGCGYLPLAVPGTIADPWAAYREQVSRVADKYAVDQARQLLDLPVIPTSDYLNYNIMVPPLTKMSDHLLLAQNIGSISTKDILRLFISDQQAKSTLFSQLGILDKGIEPIKRQIAGNQQTIIACRQQTPADADAAASDIAGWIENQTDVLSLLLSAIEQHGYAPVCRQVGRYLQSTAGTREQELAWLQSLAKPDHEVEQ